MSQIQNLMKRGAIAVAVCGPVAIVQSNEAFADTASEIRALKAAMRQQAARLRQLELQAAQQAKETSEARAQAKHAANVANPAKGGADAPPPVFVSFKNGLFVESEDQKYNFKVGGRMQFQGGGASQPLNGFSYHAGVRQVRLEVEGKAAGIWFYKLQYDFAGSQYGAPVNAPVQGGIRDFFLGLQHPALRLPFAKDPIYFQIGSYFEPFSLEYTASSRFRDFIERAMAVETFAPNRHLGASVGAYGDNWSAKGGVFTTSFEDLSTNPARGVPATIGVPAFPGLPHGTPWWVATGGGQYYDLTGRATWAPIKSEHDLLHIGVSGRFHRPNDATALSDDRVLAPGNRIRSEAFILGQGLLGAPDLSCGPIAVPASPVFNRSTIAGKCVNSVESFGVELSAAHGPFSVQAEYFGSRYNRNETNILLARRAGNFAPGGPSQYFSGYYVYGQWYLTGEERAAAYGVSEKTGANFNQIKIKHPLSEGGPGAVGLAARYSVVNLNNGPFQGSYLYNLLTYNTVVAPNPILTSYVANAGVIGGRQENVTLGLNWYPDNGVHFQANWTRVMNISAPLNNNLPPLLGGANQAYFTGAHPNLFEVRAQVYW